MSGDDVQRHECPALTALNDKRRADIIKDAGGYGPPMRVVVCAGAWTCYADWDIPLSGDDWYTCTPIMFCPFCGERLLAIDAT